MTTTDCATEIPALQGESSQDAPRSFSSEASKPLKSLLWGFGATVTIGLTLATWYVGVRIVAADEVAPAAASASSSANIAPANSAPAQVVQAVATIQAATPPANLGFLAVQALAGVLNHLTIGRNALAGENAIAMDLGAMDPKLETGELLGDFRRFH